MPRCRLLTAANLDRLAGMREGSDDRVPYQLSSYDDDGRIRKYFQVKIGPGPYAFLIWKETGEEVVLEVQGLIFSCALPPITNRTRWVVFSMCQTMFTGKLSGFRSTGLMF